MTVDGVFDLWAISVEKLPLTHQIRATTNWMWTRS